MANKSFFLLIVLMLLSILTSSQELKELKIIGKPKKLNSDHVARMDQNGIYCAAIQVVSDMDGFSYDSNDGIVGNVDDNPSMDIVYLTASERVLKIFNRGYKPLEVIFIEHGISLNKGEMWKLEIGSDGLDDKIPVIFETTPSEASIFIDNILINGNSGSIQAGRHILRIQKEGYITIEKEIIIDKQHVFFDEKLEKEIEAILQIESIPEAAKVYINETFTGETPFSIFHSPGKFSIRIENNENEAINDSIIINSPQTRKVYNLIESVGYITVNTKSNAKVYINKELIEDPNKIKLSPQILNVKVVFINSEPIEKMVELKRDDNITVDIFPKLETGTLKVTTIPFKSELVLTGDTCHKYMINGGQIFEDLPIGTYTLNVRAAGYQTYNEIVFIEPNIKMIREIKLKEYNINDSQNEGPIEMILVKGGCFNMGSNEGKIDEQPVHKVCLSNFYIGKYEVTQKQWRDIMGKLPSVSGICDCFPVTNVSGYDIKLFIKELNKKTGLKYRLPTEAEWEYAAKGGLYSENYLYSGSDSLNEVGWYDLNSQGKKHPVGHKKPNELAIHDMSGNVWEYCQDFYEEDYYQNTKTENPKGPGGSDIRVVRGGSYFYPSIYSHVSNRHKVEIEYSDFNLGFRLVLKD